MNKVLAGVTSFVFVIVFLHATSALSQSVPIIGADRVWALQVNGQNITGSGQVVCVIDSGIDYTHPNLGSCTRGQFLAGQCEKVIGGYTFYDNVTADRNDIMDNWGHGTHVAGIIAAEGNVRGVAPDAKLVGVKACAPGFCDDSAVLEAFNWCLDNQQEYGITIISMSVGHDIYNRAQCDSLNSSYNEAFATARARGIPVVVAGGNDGSQNGLAFPACLSNAIAVGATTKSDNIASWSDRNSAMMSLMGPGQDITSTWIGGGLSLMSGTSQATPHVSGTIALINQILAEQGQSKTPIEIEDLLEETGWTVTDNNGATYKRVDTFAAASALLQTSASNTTNQNNTNSTNQTPAIQDFSMRFITPTEGQVIRSNNFTASIEANTTVDSMDINLDGGAYYHACNSCDAFTVPVDRLEDGSHTLNLIGTLGSTAKNLTVQFIVNTTAVQQQNSTNQTQQNQTNSAQQLTGFSIASPVQGASYNDSVTINISTGNANVVNYSIDDRVQTTYSSPIIIPLSTGSHMIIVSASNSGSFNQTSVGFTVINTTIVAPQNQTNVTNSTNNTDSNQTQQNQTNSAQPATLNRFFINSPIPGRSYNDSVMLNIDVGSATNVNYSVDNGNYIAYNQPINLTLNPGNHEVIVRASNNAAYNESRVQFNIVNSTIVQSANNTNSTNQNNTNSTNQTPTPAPQTGSSSSPGGGGGSGSGGGKSTAPKKNSTANATNYSVTIALPDLNAIIQNLSLRMNNSVNTQITVKDKIQENSTSNSAAKIEKSPSKITSAIRQIFKNMIADFNNLIFKIFRVGI